MPQCGEGFVHFAFCSDLEMDVIALENAARKIGFVGVPAFEPFEGGLLVPEGFEEGKGESLRVERLLGEPRDGFFDFDGVH